MARVNERAWELLEEDKENRLPTPPIRTPVQWYLGGDRGQATAAMVTGVEGPGRLMLVIFQRNSIPMHRTGVYYVTHRMVTDKTNGTVGATLKEKGSWGLEEGFKIPESWYAVHDADIARREANLVEGERQAAAAAEIFEKKQAERKAGVSNKKKIIDVLQAPTV